MFCLCQKRSSHAHKLYEFCAHALRAQPTRAEEARADAEGPAGMEFHDCAVQDLFGWDPFRSFKRFLRVGGLLKVDQLRHDGDGKRFLNGRRHFLFLHLLGCNFLSEERKGEEGVIAMEST